MFRIRDSVLLKKMTIFVLSTAVFLGIAFPDMTVLGTGKTIYMSPRNDAAYSLVTETEVILGLMASDHDGIQQGSNSVDVSGKIDDFKSKISINGIKLGTAMLQDSGVKLECPSWATGLLRVRITFKNTDGTSHNNPFNITSTSSWVLLELEQGITVGESSVGATKAYYSLVTKSWSSTQPAELPSEPPEGSDEPITPRSDNTLMCKVTRGDKIYYQLWFKATGEISASNIESLISINGISIADARALASEPESIIFNMTNDKDRKNFFIYVQCRITNDDKALNPFEVTGKDDITVIFGSGMKIGTTDNVPAAKWSYTVADGKWEKDETYVAPSFASLTYYQDKVIQDGANHYYQVAVKSSVKLSSTKTDLLADDSTNRFPKLVMLNNLIIGNITAGRIVDPDDLNSGFRLIADGNYIYLQFKVEVDSGNKPVKALNKFKVTGPDGLKISFRKGFNANGIPLRTSVFTYNSETKKWVKTLALDPRAVITNATAEIYKKDPNNSDDTNGDAYIVLNFGTSQSVIENNGSGNFQATSSAAAQKFNECVYFNGISIAECAKMRNPYVCMVWCTTSGIRIWLNKDRKQENGSYDNINNYFGIDFNTDFTFEVKDGLVLNGNAIEPCKWIYHGDTHTFTEVLEEYENPETVEVVSYNNCYNEGIIRRSTGYQYVIRLGLDKVVLGAKYTVSNKTFKDKVSDPEGFAISQSIRNNLYLDGMNFEFWSGYRNSSMNIADVHLMGGTIEIRPFEDYLPAMHPDDVHWLEIKEGFTILNGVKVKPIKLYYDPDKGYWEKVDSFDNLKKPQILVKRETIQYSGSNYTVSNPSWLTLTADAPEAVVEAPGK